MGSSLTGISTGLRRCSTAILPIMTQSEDTNRWSNLPEHVSLEDTITMKAIDPGQDSTPDADLERYWAAREQG
jgi:hypothetical protein